MSLLLQQVSNYQENSMEKIIKEILDVTFSHQYQFDLQKKDGKIKPTLEKRLLFRYHRGSLDESMKTVFQFKDREDLLEKILKYYEEHRIPLINNGNDFKCIPYGGIDKRIGWDTHLIILDGYPAGMTNCSI